MSTSPDRPARPGLAAGICAVLVLLLSIGPSAWLWTQRSRLPEQVISHWGAHGRPDGWQDLNTSLVSGSVLGLVVGLLLLALGAGMKLIRELGGVATGLSAFVSTLSAASTWAQRDGNADVPIDAHIALGVGVGLAVGVLTALLLRALSGPQRVTTSDVRPADTLHVTQEATIAWTGHLRVGTAMWVSTIGVSAVLLVVALVLAVLAQWWTALLMVLLALLLGAAALMAGAQITIDRRGLRVRASGVTVVNVPLGQITGAVAKTVHPMGDFGGWGWRYSVTGDKQGIVTSEGPGIEVGRHHRRTLVLTIDDAEAAARSLNSLVAAHTVSTPEAASGSAN